MKGNLHFVRPAVALGAALALVMVLVPAAPPAAQGVDPTPFREARFGIVSLARLQNARLSVVNLLPRDPNLPPNPCRVSIGFLSHEAVSGVDPDPFHDAAGAPIMLELDLHPGQAAFLELTSADAFRGTRLLRRPFRASGLFIPPIDPDAPRDTGAPDPCAAVIPSLEIYDVLTGRTQIFTNPLEIFGFNPQPEPPLPGAGGSL